MSFLSAFKSFLHVASNPVVQKAASAIPGTAGSAFATALSFIGILEAAFPAAGAGAQKNDVVTQATAEAHPGIDQAAVSAEVTKIVKALNMLQESEKALQALQAAAKPLAPPATP